MPKQSKPKNSERVLGLWSSAILNCPLSYLVVPLRCSYMILISLNDDPHKPSVIPKTAFVPMGTADWRKSNFQTPWFRGFPTRKTKGTRRVLLLSLWAPLIGGSPIFKHPGLGAFQQEKPRVLGGSCCAGRACLPGSLNCNRVWGL